MTVQTSAVSGSRRRPVVVVVAMAVLLATVVGAAVLGGLPRPIQGVFVDGPVLDDGEVINAIPLPDARVLVGVRPEEGTVPGTSTLQCSPPCEGRVLLLDPRTGVYQPTADAPTALAVESMARLDDGRVLILGDPEADAGERSATIYDPVTDTFEVVGETIDARVWPFLVTLQDGRVLIGGGTGRLDRAELFDPTTNTFTPTSSLTRPRGFGAGVAMLADGRVLIAGGGADVGTSAEIFDPAAGTFAATGSMSVPRGAVFSATLLPDDRVLFAGGLVPDATDPDDAPLATATAEIYDPVAATFTAVGSMAEPRFWHAASILRDGTVLIAGGANEVTEDEQPVATTDAELFDPTTGTFRVTGSLHRGRIMPAALTIDDEVLLLGHLAPFGGDPLAGATSEWFR